MHQARSKRVPKNRHRHCHRLLHNGIHRILREAHSHPHKQYHRERISVEFRRLYLFIRDPLKVTSSIPPHPPHSRTFLPRCIPRPAPSDTDLFIRRKMMFVIKIDESEMCA